VRFLSEACRHAEKKRRRTGQVVRVEVVVVVLVVGVAVGLAFVV
jgi:predicted nucleic acid-binding Zn ribbon protein